MALFVTWCDTGVVAASIHLTFCQNTISGSYDILIFQQTPSSPMGIRGRMGSRLWAAAG